MKIGIGWLLLGGALPLLAACGEGGDAPVQAQRISLEDARAKVAEPLLSPDTEGAGYRALRGGSFVLDGIFVRNSMRMRLREEVRADDVGFRVLRENVDGSFGPVSASNAR